MSDPSDTQPTEAVNGSTEANAPTSQTPAHAEGPPRQSQPVAEAGSNAMSSSAVQPEAASPTTDTNQPNTVDTNEGTPQQAPSANSSGPTIESTLPEVDSSIQAMETSQSLMDASLASFESGLPSIGSSAAPDLSLPAIDTTLPSFDSSLPAIGTDIPTMDDDHTFGDDSHFGTHDSHAGSVEPANNGNSLNGSTHYDASSNGNFHYTQHTDGHQPTQAQSQHQFQANPQPQPPPNYQTQNQDIYHNSGFSSVNTNPASNGQGQPGQIPQAPIGSPMPPMSSMGQYMTGYPSQSGIDSNGMRYPLPGDPNKMLSSGRHKKEVKRRTKTGCLTCRKRRIKVRSEKWELIDEGRLRVRGERISLVPADPAIVYFAPAQTHCAQLSALFRP